MSHLETATTALASETTSDAISPSSAKATSATLASGLYVGRVRHRRFEPIRNDFTYSGFWLYLDLAELDEVFRGRWLWSSHRAALMRFRRAVHLLWPDGVASFPSPP